MKKIKQILGVVAVFLLVVGCYSQTLQAKELTNSEMIEDSNMELYGQAKFLDDDSIQLTPLETNSSGCVWRTTLIVKYGIFKQKVMLLCFINIPTNRCCRSPFTVC